MVVPFLRQSKFACMNAFLERFVGVAAPAGLVSDCTLVNGTEVTNQRKSGVRQTDGYAIAMVSQANDQAGSLHVNHFILSSSMCRSLLAVPP